MKEPPAIPIDDSKLEELKKIYESGESEEEKEKPE